MIPIKIQCGCGQKYAFEIEPVAGRMPHAVACPACGVDGTAAANAALAARAPSPTVPPPPPTTMAVPAAGGVRLAGSAGPAESGTAPTARGAVSHIPKVDRAQVETEARAKVSWGDPPETVLSFLMVQGLTFEEASALVQSMYAERAAVVRKNGFKKLGIGIAMMFVPVIAFFAFMAAGYLPLKIFAVTILIGLWGAWRALKALFMIFAPKSEPGDVAEQ